MSSFATACGVWVDGFGSSSPKPRPDDEKVAPEPIPGSDVAAGEGVELRLLGFNPNGRIPVVRQSGDASTELELTECQLQAASVRFEDASGTSLQSFTEGPYVFDFVTGEIDDRLRVNKTVFDTAAQIIVMPLEQGAGFELKGVQSDAQGQREVLISGPLKREYILALAPADQNGKRATWEVDLAALFDFRDRPFDFEAVLSGAPDPSTQESFLKAVEDELAVGSGAAPVEVPATPAPTPAPSSPLPAAPSPTGTSGYGDLSRSPTLQWALPSDPTVASVELAVGTAPGRTGVRDWLDVGLVSSTQLEGLTLTQGGGSTILR